MTATQENRPVAVASPLGADALLFRHMTGIERLGRPFEYRLDMLSEDENIQADDVLGRPLSVRLDQPAGGSRQFHGYVTEFGYAGVEGRYAAYRATVRPWLWFLTRTADCRIFQQMTAPDIIQAVFRDGDFTDFEVALTETYITREYCVQYRETDFDFVSRLMEQEGIYYYFKHTDQKHTLVLCDAVSAHQAASGYETVPWRPPGKDYERDCLTEWSVAQRVRTGKYALTDYDFERPRAEMAAQRDLSGRHPQAGGEVFDYPGLYVQQSDGEDYARRHAEAEQSDVAEAVGRGNARGLAVGYTFTLEDFPRGDQNGEYLVVGTEYRIHSDPYEGRALGEGDEFHCECRVTAINSRRPFRTPRTTPRPLVRGPQTAVVVGKEEDEILTDEYGRVKVQFHWDRYGKSNEDSSCWIRVAQVWAGNKWGGMFIPRVGQEVLVDFLEGDPDRPIITGRVYNADQMPPYALPENMTQSGLKTRSTKGGDEKTFNELRFEDKKGEEHIYFHAEKDFERVVENNDSLKVGFDKKDQGDQSIAVFNNRTLTVGDDEASDGSETVTIKKNRTATLKEGNESLTVQQGDRTVQIDQGNDALTLTQGNRTVKLTAGTCTIEAGQGITLKVGPNSIEITPQGITIKGLQTEVQGTAQLTLSGPMTTLKGDGVLTLQGGMVKIN